MMTKTKRFVMCLAASSLLAMGCSKNKKQDEGATPEGPVKPVPLAEVPGPDGNTSDALDTDLLAYVPADSPFVMAMLRTFPEDFVDRMAEEFTPLVNLGAAAMTMAKDDPDTDPLARAVLEELDGKLSRAGMESLGITLRPRMIFYAIGWSLAMRVQLADGARFNALVDRVEARAGQSLPKVQLGDLTYRAYIKDDTAVVFAVIDDYLVLGVMHENARAQVLPTLFGSTKPAESMLDTGVVGALVDKYKLMGVSTTLVDSQAVLRFFSGQAAGLSKEIIDASELDLPELSEVCRQEFSELAGAVPRLVFGYQQISDQGYEGVMSLEMRPDLAGELAQLQVPSVDITKLAASRPLFAVGLALNLDAAVAWVNTKARGMKAKPYRCEHLRELNEVVADMDRALHRELPPFVAGAHGAALMVRAFEAGGLVPRGEGYGALGVQDPRGFYEMLQQYVPPLKEVQPTQGKPTEVALGLPGMDKADVLLQDRWLGAAVGPGMTEALVSFLGSESNAESPFLVMAYDYRAMMAMSQAMDGSQADAAELEVNRTLGNFMGYSTTTAHFTKDGVLLRVKNENAAK